MTLNYVPGQGSYALTPLAPAAPVPDPPQILALQTPPTAPQNDALATVTNALNITPSMATRLRNFPEEVYNLDASSHLVRLIKVLIGDAGAGQLRKRMMQARMGTIIQGANFYDLDAFYGSLFGLVRRSDEQLPINPYTDGAEADVWSAIRSLDASYRARIDQFGKAISFGASPIGIELVAEAILQCPCSIYEGWVNLDGGPTAVTANTWTQVEAAPTWTQVETEGTWTQVETTALGTSGGRKNFTVTPHRPITQEEAFDLRRVLNVIKPADTVVTINTTGADVHTPIALRGVYSDSSYWELVSGVIPNGSFASYYNLSSTVQPGGWREPLRPALTEYQGEQISYGGDIQGVTAFDQDTSGNVTANQVIDSYTFQDGTTLYYPPSQAIATRFFSLAGRYVSDGILQAAPYSAASQNVSTAQVKSSTGTSSTSPVPPLSLFVDGLPIVNMVNALETPGTVNNLGIETPAQRFWSTPPRLGSDLTEEVLDVHLVAKRLINSITFAVAHYPQTVQVQTKVEATGEWNTIYSQTIFDSVPSILSNAPVTSHEHPQHSAAGHWTTLDLKVDPITTDEIRVVLQRNPFGTGPVTQELSLAPVNQSYPTVFTPVPYSLGIQDFAVGYQVTQESDLPLQPLITQDALGSQVQFTVRREVANNTINGSTIPWRSAPQPTSDSVVNFYIDTRNGLGQPQLVDRIFMDPTYIGPHCTLYYSNDDTTNLGFAAEATDLVAPIATSTGQVSTSGFGLAFDTLNPSWVDIENSAIQFDPAQPWWCGVVVIPDFDSVNGSGETIWDFGNGLRLSFGSNTVIVSGGSTSATVSNVTFTRGAMVYITVAYVPVGTEDFSAGLYLFYNSNSPLLTEQGNLAQGRLVEPDLHPIFSSRFQTGGYSAICNPVSMGVPQPDLRFGAAQTSPTAGSLTIVGLCLKQGAFTANDLTDFQPEYLTYTTLTGTNSNNSILRYDLGNVSTTNVLGFVGGPGDFWSLLNWTPIMRDYVVQKGYMELPPTAAAYFKLEFTNLIAQPLATLLPISKTVQTHQGISQSLVQQTSPPRVSNPGASVPGTAEAIALATGIYFNDSPNINAPVTAPAPLVSNQPTSVQVASDINTQTNLANSAWYWQYQTWSPHPDAPRFVQTGVHTYNTANVTQSNQVSFFVGLNSIGASRLDFSTNDDTRIYDETFYDDLFITSTTIPQNPGDLNTVGVTNFPVTATSGTFNSSDPVSGLQFATIQSDAVEIAYNDNFADPATGNTWNDIANVQSVGDATPVYRADTQTVLVSRNNLVPPDPYAAPVGEGLVEKLVYPIFEEITTSSVSAALTPMIGTYNSRPGNTVPGFLDIVDTYNFGGLSNAYAPTGSVGTIYAAVRLTTNDVLASPLSLELVDLATGDILASKPVSCAPGQLVEEYVGYTLSGSRTVAARIVQYGQANNTWIVDRLSTFDTGWTWTFSNDGGVTWINALDNRNDAYGIINFPNPGTGFQWQLSGSRANLHVQHLRIRPIYSGFKSDSPLGIVQGPNMSSFDHTPPITEDPFFTQNFTPIPYWWFAAAQEYPILGVVSQPVANQYNRFYVRTASESL